MEAIAVNTVGSTKNLITQSNQLTEARYSLTIAEQRLVITLLSLISPKDEELKDYEIKVSDFKSLLSLNTNAVYDQMKEVLKKLAGRVLQIPTPTGYILTHWFSSAEYNSKNGSVQISFDKKLTPYLLQLKEQFTKYRLFTITQFKSSYTVRIYMLLKQYERIGFREIEVVELRQILDIDDKKYPLFKDFRKWVLNKVKKEFEKKNKGGAFQSDITFDLETIRTGRKITRLRFNIRKQAYQEALPLEIYDDQEEGGKGAESQAIEALIKHGISKELAQSFEEEQGGEAVLNCVKMYEEKLNSGVVKAKGGGYLLTMLKARAGEQTPAEKEAEKVKLEKERNLKKQKQEQAKAEQEKEEKYKQEKSRRLKEFEVLPQKKKEKLLGEFEKSLISVMRKTYKKNGLDNPMISGTFNHFLAEKEK